MEQLNLFLVIGAIVIIVVTVFFMLPSKKEKEEKIAMLERLKDETITIPETGEKFSLDEIESTIWMNKLNIESLSNKSGYRQINFISYLDFVSENKLSKKDLNESDFEVIESLWLFNKHDEWHYSDPYADNNFRIVLIKSEDLRIIDVLCEFKVEESNVQILAIDKNESADYDLNLEPMENAFLDNYDFYLIDNSDEVITNPIEKYLTRSPRFNHELFKDSLFVMFDLKMFEVGIQRIKDLKRTFANKGYTI